MAPYRDMTRMGGEQGRFQTTHWSEILDAKTCNQAHRKTVVDHLIKSYWKPVYCFLRRKGCTNAQAKDLTQGFFCDVAWGRDMISHADQSKGRFRTFLLHSLENYTRDVHEKASALKRGGDTVLVHLDVSQAAQVLTSHANSSPDHVFNYVWAGAIMQEVLDTVRQECVDSDKEIHWQVFSARVVVPIMESTPPPALGEICSKVGIRDEVQASEIIYRMKKRFQSAMRRCLRRHVESDDEVDKEYSEIVKILSQGQG